MLDELSRADEPRLLLGVTPELAALEGPLVAIDWSAVMIERIWPGGNSERAVVQADWLGMPFRAASFGACIGDGVINMLHWPDEVETLFARLRQVVRPGGRIALRTFCMPDARETPDDLRAAVFAGGIGFHAFKWRLAQAAMTGENVAVREVWQVFQALFPDREALSTATGWAKAAVSEIDDYAVSTLSKCFQTRAKLRSILPDARFIESSGYELAERCPVLVVDL